MQACWKTNVTVTLESSFVQVYFAACYSQRDVNPNNGPTARPPFFCIEGVTLQHQLSIRPEHLLLFFGSSLWHKAAGCFGGCQCPLSGGSPSVPRQQQTLPDITHGELMGNPVLCQTRCPKAPWLCSGRSADRFPHEVKSCSC